MTTTQSRTGCMGGDCQDAATWLHVAYFDMRLEPTDGPDTMVSVRTLCSRHSTDAMGADSADPALTEAVYRPLPA
jgi:hypothetical protein